MRFSVILNTFNRAHFLPLVLTAWQRPTSCEFEMIIADDGSEDGTREVIQELAPRLPFPVTHVHHENQGHRRAEILNKAVSLAEHEALLFTDADSLPARNLLEVHSGHFNSGRLLCGGYIRLGEAYTETIDLENAARGDYESQLTARHLRALNRLHLKNRFYTLIRRSGRPHVMGLNMCLPRSAFIEINGYDNEFRGWGRADGDLRERLKRVGVRPFSDWNTAIVFHLHHPPDETKKLRANVQRSDRPDIPVRAENGFAEVTAEVAFRSRS